MKHTRFAIAAAVLAFTGAGAALAAAQSLPVPIPDRARGAERIVVATVANTSSRYVRNEFGDELIVTRAELAVEEAIKGTAEPAVIEIEGGTVDGITLRVSDLPVLETGERGVFFLTRGRGGAFKPHLRGQ